MQDSITERLKSISFFSDMSDYDLEQIAEITEEKTYAKGDAIIEERTSAERFFIISSGKIKITKQFEDGEEFVLAVHSDGDFFGEMALLDEGPRSATARAVEPTTVLEITRPNFETLLYRAPVVAYHIIRELSSRLRETGALLVSALQRRNRQLYRSYLDTITTIMKALEKGKSGAAKQSRRIQDVSRAIGQQMKLSEEQMLTLEINALAEGLAIEGFPEPLSPKPGAVVQRIIAVAAAFVGAGETQQALKAIRQDKNLDSRISEVLSGLLKAKRLSGSGDST
ncbi:MAG: cyclic nucleotide-binding domain-containing protein [Spirochaetaceae bacterium]|nr:MAG: cyclic nucleotide-binding domain-containing protein [Spirochaetaceae bacterium]